MLFCASRVSCGNYVLEKSFWEGETHPKKKWLAEMRSLGTKRQRIKFTRQKHRWMLVSPENNKMHLRAEGAIIDSTRMITCLAKGLLVFEWARVGEFFFMSSWLTGSSMKASWSARDVIFHDNLISSETLFLCVLLVSLTFLSNNSTRIRDENSLRNCLHWS